MNVNFQNLGGGTPLSEFAQSAYGEAIHAELAQAFGGGANMFETMYPNWAEAMGGEQQDEGPEGPPPISARALGELPVVTISEEDLVTDGNDYCCVCLEAQKVGDKATKLPCGHLFHTGCAVGWLKKHCTCPNCRYELESAEPAFESGRAQRMRERKPRYRLRDLERSSVRELKGLLRDHQLSSMGLCEKRDFVEALVSSGRISIVPEPRIDLGCDDQALRTHWTLRQVKDLMAQAGVDSARCVNKDDLVDEIVRSGRVVFAPCHDDDHRAAASASTLAALRLQDLRRRGDLLDCDDDGRYAAACDEPTLTKGDLDGMSVKQLKAHLTRLGLANELKGCCDKDHMRRVLASALDLADDGVPMDLDL